MIYAELVSPNSWFSTNEPVLLLPYPEALKSELRHCTAPPGAFANGEAIQRRVVGFLLDLENEQPALLKVCAESTDEMSSYITTGKWKKGTTFEKTDLSAADLKSIAWFGDDIMSARKKLPEPYATHVENFLTELLAHGLKIS